jgi:leucyl aminopeptidase
MKTTAKQQPIEQIVTEALIIPVFEGKREQRFGAGDLFDSGEISGKTLELTLVHHPPGVAAQRVLLAGAGKSEKFDAAELRKLVGAAVRHLKSKSVKTIALALEGGWAAEDYVSAAVEGAILGQFEPDRYKTSDDKKTVESFTVVTATDGANFQRAAERGRIIAEAQNFTRALVNDPPQGRWRCPADGFRKPPRV